MVSYFVQQPVSFHNCTKFIVFRDRSIGAILQAQIFDNYINPEHLDLVVEEFEVEILLPPELGGPTNSIPEEVLNHETLNDLELRDKLIDGVVPTVDTMYK